MNMPVLHLSSGDLQVRISVELNSIVNESKLPLFFYRPPWHLHMILFTYTSIHSPSHLAPYLDCAFSL